MERTTTRLRKTFRYPADNDSDDSLPEALDEEEQDNLIQTLHQANTHQNIYYTYILLAFSLFCTLPYIPTLFHPTTSLLSLLSISSLLSTSFLLYALPPPITSIPLLDSLNQHPPSTSVGRRKQPSQNFNTGPLLTYLPYLNLGLSSVLVGLGWLLKRKGEHIWGGFAILPLGIYTVVLLAKVVMGSVDPEGELGGLRYGFKGA